MKKQILAGLAGIALFTGGLTLWGSAGTSGAIVNQFNPEQELVKHYTGYVQDRFMRAGTVKQLQAEWSKLMGYVVRDVTNYRNQYPNFPADKAMAEAVQYINGKYFEQKKRIENFKPIEMPKAPWEQ